MADREARVLTWLVVGALVVVLAVGWIVAIELPHRRQRRWSSTVRRSDGSASRRPW